LTPVALTIAGSDPSGGAGIQADLKTFHRFGVYGEAVITLITVQNTRGVSRVEILPADLIEDQIAAVLEDIPPGAAKLGALGNEAAIAAIARMAERFSFPLVIDPVMISKHGAPLMSEAAQALVPALLQRATLVTPNLHEAATLSGLPISTLADMHRAAEKIAGLGPKAVLIKGGHLAGDAIDVLFDGRSFEELRAERINTPHTHGTGCTYSAAITAELAKGTPLHHAIRIAKGFVTRGIATNPGLGSGAGPLNHHA
jgi:hydroxymethylpyrimidine/phosphomethylpyrimidine kinase